MPAPVLRRRTAAGAGRAGVRVRAPPRCSARARGRARPPRRHRLTQVSTTYQNIYFPIADCQICKCSCFKTGPKSNRVDLF